MSIDFFRGPSYCLPANAFSSIAVYTKIQSFYQYRMVPPTMSVLSNALFQRLSESEKDTLWSSLLKAAGVPEENFIFSSLLWTREKEITNLKLSDSTLACDRIKGVLCWETSLLEFGDKIRKLDLLFLRIRNAFAHGRIAALGDFLVFEDRDKLQQLTARIVLNEKTLLLWMKIIIFKYNIAEDNITVAEDLNNLNNIPKKHIISDAWVASRAITPHALSELKTICNPANGQRLEKNTTGYQAGTYYVVPYQEPIKEELKRFLKMAYIPITQNKTSYVLEVYISPEERTILISEEVFRFCEREIVLEKKLKIKTTEYA